MHAKEVEVVFTFKAAALREKAMMALFVKDLLIKSLPLSCTERMFSMTLLSLHYSRSNFIEFFSSCSLQ